MGVEVESIFILASLKQAFFALPFWHERRAICGKTLNIATKESGQSETIYFIPEHASGKAQQPCYSVNI